ncbi:MAG: UDP-N-acetylmuramoyl-L-alanyl-D-glutamate--2,6-diaminopimelate ligase [Clostridiales bacterium]|nr:UDP-N-acetylmuramoyl-L-alanyl-D-glutamate--2,6-diaminopimelate ligase [Clostridiales bacterium]
MKLSELFKNIEYTVLCGNADACEVDRIEYNSRLINEGELFVCLPGARADGHDFAAAAYRAGCRAFLCERPLDLPSNAFQAATPDTRSALAEISAAFYGYPAEKLHIIGITGTKGKTTTSLLIQSILEKSGIPCAYIGSNGVIINGKHVETVNTTPESRELQHYFSIMLSEGVTHAVIEVSSQALNHNRVQGISFDVCIFTNLSPDHIGEGEHASFEEYRAAKKKLFTDYGCRLAIFNEDDDAASFMKDGISCPALVFSTKDENADFVGTSPMPYRDETSLGIFFNCSNAGRTTRVQMRNPGEFSVCNGLAAIAACSYYGVSVKDAADILALTSVTGRFEVVDGIPGRTFIIDYAHNGLSLTSALTVLRKYEPERLICVFGSVGGRTKNRRRELAEASSALADYSIITSDNPDFEAPSDITDEILEHYDKSTPYEVIIDREDAVRRAVQMAEQNDIVLFAGKGHERYQLIRGEKVPFSEREIIRDECRTIMLQSAAHGE